MVGRNSSAALPWTNIYVEQRVNGAGEYSYPARSVHRICLHLGQPAFLEHIRDGQRYSGVLPPGGLQIIPAGMDCTWRHPAEARFIAIDLAIDVIQRVAADVERNHVELLGQFGIQDRRIEYICLALQAEMAAGGPSGRLYTEGLATALAAHLLSSYSSSAPARLPEMTGGLSPSRLQQVTSIIEDRLAEDLGLAELAAEAGLSQSHFARLFRLSTGLSPHQYVVQRRVQRAQSLLQMTTLSAGEIAAMVGFCDHSHLVRQMRRVLGVTPTDVRDLQP